MSHVGNDVTISEEKIDFIQPYSNLFDHQELGSGHFGVTYLSTLKRTDQPPLKVVCKVSRTKPGEDEWHEMQNLCNLKLHPLVVRLLGICTDWQGAAIALLFEYHPGGTLEKIAREQHVAQSDADGVDLLKMAYAMACSVQHIHANGVLHRDIALRNFVVSSGGLPVLIDFGMSRGDVEYKSLGDKPVPWRSIPPEALGAEKLSMPKSDVYMLGIAFWQLFNRVETPFPHANSPGELLNELNIALESAPDATAPLGHCERMPEVMRDLVAKMCSLSMGGRPTAAETCDILAAHVPADLHRLSSSSCNVDSEHKNGDAFDFTDAISEYEYTPAPAAQPSSMLVPQALSALSPQKRSLPASEALNTPSADSLEQDDDAEPSMSARGKILLEHIESAGVYNPKAVTHALRHEQIEANDLRDLTDEQLRRLFPKIGAFNRMKKFINREPSLTNRGQALYNDLQYLKLPNIEGVVRMLRKENIDMDLLAKLSDQELEELLSKVSEVGTRKLLRQYVQRFRKARSLLPDSLRRIYEVSSSLFRSTERSRDGWTKLHVAAAEGKTLAIESMLNSGKVDPNSRTNKDETPLHTASRFGKDSAVAMLLSDMRVDVHAVDDKGHTALHNAAELGDTSILSRLLKDGRLDPNTRNHYVRTPLHIAAWNRNDASIAVLLADDRTDVTLMDDRGKNALQYAARRSGSHGLSCLLKDGRMDPNCRTASQKTPLHLAAQEGNVETLAVLLGDERVDASAVDATGENALHHAARGQFYYQSHLSTPPEECAVLRLLLTDGRLDPNSRNKRGEAPLHIAVHGENDAAVATLLGDERTDVNAVNEEGESALHYAARCRVPTKVASRLLQDARLDPNIRNLVKETALRVAIRQDNDTFVDILLGDDRVNADLNFVGNIFGGNVMHAAAQRGNVNALSRLLKTGRLDPNSRNDRGRTPLHVAARAGDGAAVAVLLSDDRVDVSAVDEDGQSALHYAAQHGNSEALSRLLTVDHLDPNFRNSRKKTPLHVAARGVDDAAVAMLLNHDRVDVSAVDEDGNSAVHFAAQYGNVDALPRLLRVDHLDPNLQNSRGRTALHLAARRRDSATVAVLLRDDHRVDVSAVDLKGQSAMHYAAEYGSCEALSRLLKVNRVNPNSRNLRGQTPLHVAARVGDGATVAVLLSDDRVDVSAIDEDGDCAMHHASRRNSFSNRVLSRLLSDVRSDPNARNKREETPLHVAAREGNYVQVPLLLSDERVDLNAVDGNGDTAMHHAARRQNTDVLSILLNDGRLSPNSRNNHEETPFQVASLEKAAAMLLNDKRVNN